MEPNTTNNEPEMIYPQQASTGSTGEGVKKNTALVLLVGVLILVVIGAVVFFAFRGGEVVESDLPAAEHPGSSSIDVEDAGQREEVPVTTTGALPISGSDSVDGISASEAETTLEDIQTQISTGAITEAEAEQKKAEVYEQLPPPPLPPMP